jgi:ABC-type uncharacterized transport system permease subunit
MTFDLANMIYVALALYGVGTVLALTSLVLRDRRPQQTALFIMIAGWVAHTIWIGTICARTGHPPLTNLPEAAGFLSWTIFAVEIALYIRYRVHAAAFFVYPLVLLILTVAAVVGEPFAHLNPKLRSSLFTSHLLLTTLGIALLLVGLAFTILQYVQDRALKSKRRGALWEWIPSLDVCRTVSYRSLAIGFSVYTVGLITGSMWAWRTTAELIDLQVKEIGAVVAWILFAVLLQSYISGAFRGKRTIYISGAAFVAIIVAILGIART